MSEVCAVEFLISIATDQITSGFTEMLQYKLTLACDHGMMMMTMQEIVTMMKGIMLITNTEVEDDGVMVAMMDNI